MKLIIGHTGLVGSTIKEQRDFDFYFNSKNINTFNDVAKDGDELFLCCLPATKWMVNNNVKNDLDNIYDIVNTISQKKYSKINLISTIDVYIDSPIGSNEDFNPVIEKLHYGSNRYLFEIMVKQFVKCDDLKIFRLPALFNKHIKKNIIYDLLNNNNIDKININSSYQWYNLDRLSNDIEFLSLSYKNNQVFNLFPEPVETKDIVNLFSNVDLKKLKSNSRMIYDFKTKLSPSGYFIDKMTTIENIKKFINEYSIK